MRQSTFARSPSLVSDLGSLAKLYRTVFWMIGRKAHYGRIWPSEADMGPEEQAPALTAPPVASIAATHPTPVEAAAARD